MSSNIGKYIKQLREERDMSIRQLALYSGVSYPHISRLERGLRPPTPDILLKLAKALHVPHEDLFYKAGFVDRESKIRQDEAPKTTELEELLKQDTILFHGEPIDEEAKQGILRFLMLVRETSEKRKK